MRRIYAHSSYCYITKFSFFKKPIITKEEKIISLFYPVGKNYLLPNNLSNWLLVMFFFFLCKKIWIATKKCFITTKLIFTCYESDFSCCKIWYKFFWTSLIPDCSTTHFQQIFQCEIICIKIFGEICKFLTMISVICVLEMMCLLHINF